MRRRTDAMTVIALALVALGALDGCVATAQSAPARGVVVSGPPPAPLVEERPPQPTPNANGTASAAWVAGYWHWTGMQYAWIPGHWEAAPPGASWAAPRYTQADGAYFYEPGGWNSGQAPPRASQAQQVQASPHANALR